MDIFTHIGALLLGGYLGFLYDRKILKQQELYRATKELKESFIPALIELDEIRDIRSQGYSQGDFPSDIVKRHFDNHETAVYKFKDYLNKETKNDFMKAWDEFAYPNKALSIIASDNDLNEIPNPEYFSTYQPDIVEIRKKLRIRINKILSFAEFK
jgi:hypothetical protein